MSSTKNVKIGIFGGSGSGKTGITLRYLKEEHSEGYIPTIEDEFSKVIEIDNNKVNVSIVDTAGFDDYGEMRFRYLSQVQGYVFVFDIGDPQSIEYLRSVYKDAQDSRDDDNIICAIAANNGQLRKEKKSGLVPIKKYKELETEFKCKVFEISVKSGQNINEIFEYVARRILNPRLHLKPRFSLNAKEAAPPEPLNVEQTKRRSSLFSKRSDKRKSKEIPQNETPPDHLTNKLIDDLKALALAKANQLKNSIQTNRMLEEKVENLENELKLKNNQIDEYLQKIKFLENELKNKTSQAVECQNNLYILQPDELSKINKSDIIGRGSFSEAAKISVKQDMVLKSYYIDLFRNNGSDEGINIEIMKEIRNQYNIVNKINNPYIAKAFGIYFGDDYYPPSILLEYFPYNLQGVVKKLTAIERVTIISEICSAMKEVHNFQIIHCDLNPGNVLLNSNKHVKLSDFGSSAFIKSDVPLISRTQVYQTQTFIAPELLLCESEYNEKVDVYSFGVIVYFILTKGKHLTSKNDGADGISINPNSKINEFSCNLINKCCSKMASQRPSFVEIAEIMKQSQFKLIDGIDADSIKNDSSIADED